MSKGSADRTKKFKEYRDNYEDIRGFGKQCVVAEDRFGSPIIVDASFGVDMDNKLYSPIDFGESPPVDWAEKILVSMALPKELIN